MKPYSITRRLIATVLLIELASALCVTAVAYIYERHDHFRSFDILLRGRADSLLGAVQDSEDSSNTLILDNSEIDLSEDDIYEVRDDQNRLLGHSANLTDLAAKFQPEDDKPGKIDIDGDQATFGKMRLGHRSYRVIRMLGVRTVDTANPQGGIRRNITLYYGASDRPVWRAIRRAVTFYALSSLAVLAITGILMAWVLNRSLAPLRQLASGAATISVNSWNFDPPEDARRIRELAPLVTALESVLEGLQRSFEQQRRFVGDAAHELKTNVAVVKSSLQLLTMKPRTAAQYQQGLERSLADLQRMEETVGQMLSLARLEEGASIAAIATTASSTELFPCLAEIGLQLEVVAQTCGVPIHINGDKSLVAAIDPEQFQLLCTNLLINALQHCHPDSFVHVELERRAAFAEMRILDEGEGIDPGDLPHIFERFYRSDPSRSRKTGGTGLGLAICKAITERFHGNIQIDSQLGKGTTVVVRLPLAAPKPQSESEPLL